jgi:catechol 2,3-dioxygenase-like lactoylglutathione lyase family enzyme
MFAPLRRRHNRSRSTQENVMVALDHLILPVGEAARSIQFYVSVLGFAHEGRYGPFDIVRVNPALTLDLLVVEQSPQPAHLAFAMPRSEFDAIAAVLAARGLPCGPSPHHPEGGAVGMQFGAQGMASSLYFADPDGHRLEIRSYQASTHPRRGSEPCTPGK